MVQHFNDSNFDQEVLHSDIPVMVDFYADWCGPCRMVSPIVEELAGQYTGKVKVSIPTLLFVKNGQVIDQIVGALPKDKIQQHLELL